MNIIGEWSGQAGWGEVRYGQFHDYENGVWSGGVGSGRVRCGAVW